MTRPRLVFVHGRAQQGRDVGDLQTQWLATLRRGLGPSREDILGHVDVSMPFYGDVLDAFARAMDDEVPADIVVRGEPDIGDPRYLSFQEEFVSELWAKLAIGAAPGGQGEILTRGPQNWRWVLSLMRAADALPGVSAQIIERVTRDVYLYLSRSRIRRSINAIVADAIPASPTVVVAHSLGSVVAFDVLRHLPAGRRVKLLVTVGSPLGVGPIARTLAPVAHPKAVEAWFNALDRRDTVALNPLDADHFPINPPVENHIDVRNGTKNRHGIEGYLDDPMVAERIGHVLSHMLSET